MTRAAFLDRLPNRPSTFSIRPFARGGTNNEQLAGEQLTDEHGGG